MLDPKRNYLTMIREEAQPENIRSDNGSEFIAETVQEFMAANRGIRTLTIYPGSPWQNGVIESYNSCFRREFADRWWFHSYDDIAVAMGDWLWDYNCYRPHGAIGYLTPDELMGGTPGLRPSVLTQEPSETTLTEATRL
jgi:transposase InsO family protein